MKTQTCSLSHLKTMFSNANFVSLAEIKRRTGLEADAIFFLKPSLESLMREEGDNIRLVSVMHAATPGIAVEC